MSSESEHEPADQSFINQHDPRYLEFWTKELGIDEARLLHLINRHGVMTLAIRKAIDDSGENRSNTGAEVEP
jgi:hypothetical protein